MSSSSPVFLPSDPMKGGTKPSKRKNKNKNKKQGNPPLPPERIANAEERASRVDEESRGFNWLIDAFSSLSFDQINSAYCEVSEDPYLAAGILGAHLVDPGECPAEGKRKIGSRKQKTAAASAGIVSDVIGASYTKPVGRRCRGGPIELKGHAKRFYRPDEAEEFLCSMLGDDFELGMGVVRDVLGDLIGIIAGIERGNTMVIVSCRSRKLTENFLSQVAHAIVVKS